jgi:hypothetical protein
LEGGEAEAMKKKRAEPREGEVQSLPGKWEACAMQRLEISSQGCGEEHRVASCSLQKGCLMASLTLGSKAGFEDTYTPVTPWGSSAALPRELAHQFSHMTIHNKEGL